MSAINLFYNFINTCMINNSRIKCIYIGKEVIYLYVISTYFTSKIFNATSCIKKVIKVLAKHIDSMTVSYRTSYICSIILDEEILIPIRF